jgi:hypothetical protein
MAFYRIRSERQLMEQINYNLLFCWLVGFSVDDEVWNHSLFTKNQDSLLEGEVAYLGQVLMENRQVLVLERGAWVIQATGTAERDAAVELVEALDGTQRITHWSRTGTTTHRAS